jgi:hypothetical protein|tara:strand:+ start:807 stop:1496 length:690 start_codon:yes stop_codon:yes gene_type:complete
MGWKDYKLVTFGCSFTYGHGLSDCMAEDGSNGPTASEQAWPSVLGKLTGMKVDNVSEPGSSNLMITKAIVDYSKYTKDTVVVVMWSNNDRETIYKTGNEKLHMLPGFLDDTMPGTFWFDKDKNNFKKTITTYYENYHEDWNATLNQTIRMNFVHAFLKNKGIKSFHVHSEHHRLDINYFKKFNVRDLNLKYFNWKNNFHIDDALDIPKPHPGPRSHALMATNIQRWFFS